MHKTIEIERIWGLVVDDCFYTSMEEYAHFCTTAPVIEADPVEGYRCRSWTPSGRFGSRPSDWHHFATAAEVLNWLATAFNLPETP